MKVSIQFHAPAALSHGKSPGGHGIGGWVSPRDGHRDGKVLDPTGTQSPTSRSSSPHPVTIPWLFFAVFIKMANYCAILGILSGCVLSYFAISQYDLMQLDMIMLGSCSAAMFIEHDPIEKCRLLGCYAVRLL
jgi:hypothetical protein